MLRLTGGGGEIIEQFVARLAINRQIGETLIGANGFSRLCRHHTANSPAIQTKFCEAELNLAHQKTIASGFGFGIDLRIAEGDEH